MSEQVLTNCHCKNPLRIDPPCLYNSDARYRPRQTCRFCYKVTERCYCGFAPTFYNAFMAEPMMLPVPVLSDKDRTFSEFGDQAHWMERVADSNKRVDKTKFVSFQSSNEVRLACVL